MRPFLLLLILFSLGSCKRPWTQKDRDDFTGGCMNGALKEMEQAKARSYCNCMLEKVQRRYPDAGDMKYIKTDTAMYSMAIECRK
jgi:hypothetical protein